MATLTPPPDGDQDQGPAFIAVYCSIFAVAVLVTSLRFYARITIHAVGWDDWIMLLTVLLMLVLTIEVTLLGLHGGTRHLFYILLDQGQPGFARVTGLMHVALPFSFLTLATGRVSVAILILRIITRSKWRRRFLYISIIMSVVVNAVWCVIWFAGCPPSLGFAPPYIAGVCWNPPAVFAYSTFTAAWNVFMDFALALIPITVFWNLQISLKKRFSLCVLMSWGLLAAVCGAVKTAKFTKINAIDFTWEEFDLYMWTAAETILIVVCGCIPTLKPIYDDLRMRKLTFKSFSSSYTRSWGSRSLPSHARDPYTGEPSSELESFRKPLPAYCATPNQCGSLSSDAGAVSDNASLAVSDMRSGDSSDCDRGNQDSRQDVRAVQDM